MSQSAARQQQLIFAPSPISAPAQELEQDLLELLAQLILSTYPGLAVEASDDQDQ